MNNLRNEMAIMKHSILFILIVIILYGCGNNAVTRTVGSLPTEAPISVSVRSDGFSLSVLEDPNGESRRFEANGFCVDYIGLSEVSYTTSSQSIPLQDALQDGKVTVNMLIANARDDAEEKICRESTSTRNGLTCFSYIYPEYRMDVIYDIYQTPDGKEHMVKDINISATTHHVDSLTIIDDATGQEIDREDWGLTFEVANATSKSVSLKCIQSGGIQIGDLQIRRYDIQNAQDGSFPEFLPEVDLVGEDNLATIKSDSESNITIDWAGLYGELSPGDYIIRLLISDIYDPSQVHPLMRNFYDRQAYQIPFTIP